MVPRTSVRHPQFPARGRKHRLRPCGANALPLRQTPSIPRKGTETNPEFGFGRRCRCTVRHPQFPARGRKQHNGLLLPDLTIGQTPSIPRKGTETYIPSYSGLSLGTLSDTLNSPQGDGNVLSFRRPSSWRAPVSDTLNSPQGDGNRLRLGTQGFLGFRSDTLNSPQGDGNAGVRR